MKAVFLDRGSFPDTISIELPTQISEVIEYQNTQPEQVAERIKDADIVLTNKIVLNADVIQKASNLKLVQVMATGVNNVDANACQEKGIAIQNVEGYSVNSVPEHTFSMLLALRRNLVSYIQDVKAGKWSSSEHFCFLDYPIKDLHDTNMVIIGGGSLGKRVGEIAKAFGMKVTFSERKGAKEVRTGYTEFESALKVADVISINCPLSEETKNLISDAEFALMKPSALLLNISRGGIVDEHALLNAFKQQAISGAAFDVATQEPMPLEHPLHQLAEYPNFLLTPHIAWASHEAMETLVRIAVQKIAAFVEANK